MSLAFVMENKNYNSFLKLDLSKHTGEWIVICNGKVIARDKNIKKAYEEAKKKCPTEKPLITKVPEEGAMIF